MIQYTAHFFSSLFLSLSVGLAIAILLVQSELFGTYLDVSYFVTVALFFGLLSYFARVFMNAKVWALWEKKILSGILIGLSFAVIFGIGLLNGSLSILPAELTRRGLFLEDAIALNEMNIVLIVIAFIGLVSIVIAHRVSLEITKEIKMEWSRLKKSSKWGMVALFAALAVFILLYFG